MSCQHDNRFHWTAARPGPSEGGDLRRQLWYDTKTGPHYHFYHEDTEELSDIPEGWVPEFAIPAPESASLRSTWLPHPRARIERIDTEAEALIRVFGEAA
jgi:hypothetical protein